MCRWRVNSGLIQTGCTWYLGTAAGVPDNSASETADISHAIQAIANQTQVDNRFILAILMQESRGCVRITTTTSTHPNPGLMQSHAGTWTCVDRGIEPCPWDNVYGMIRDGVAGTLEGDGLAAILNQQQALGYVGAQLYYRAARVYNSGRVDDSQLLERGGATHCYVSSIANRLTGWAINQGSYDCAWDDTMVGAIITTDTSPAVSSLDVSSSFTSPTLAPVTVTPMTTQTATTLGLTPNASNCPNTMDQLLSSSGIVC